MIPVGTSAGALDVPEDPHVLGWWKDGAGPYAAAGSTVIAGHVDSAAAGPGALYRLDRLAMGAPIVMTTARGTVQYRVVGRRVYDKKALPASIFATRGVRQLVLITCGGPFDTTTRHYRDNVVVFALPQGQSPA